MVPDLEVCPLAAEAAMSLLSISASASRPCPPSDTAKEGEERHRPSTSSALPPTGSIGGGELQPRPKSPAAAAAAACETRELEEEASGPDEASAGRGGRPLFSGAPRESESEALGTPGAGRRTRSLASLGARSGLRRPRTRGGMGRRGLRETRSGVASAEEGEERHRPPTSSALPRTASIGGGELQPRSKSPVASRETHELNEEASAPDAAAGRCRWHLYSGAPHSGETEALGPPGQAHSAGHGTCSRASPGARSGLQRPTARAGMGRWGLRETRSSVAATAVTHDDRALPDEGGSEYFEFLFCVVESLKMKARSDRFTYIKKRVEENRSKLSTVSRKTSNASKVWQRNTSKGTGLVSNLLTSRQRDALCSVHSLGVSPAEEGGLSYEEQTSNATSTVMLGGNPAAKNASSPVKLPEVLKHPRYITWTFLHRNQQMAEDQSVFGRRKIYYDPNCGEALVCSDIEDEAVEEKEEKKEFNSSEDYIIGVTIEEHHMSDTVLEALAQSLNKAAGDIKARYEILRGGKTEDRDKDLDAALDSFDNLFCRRCLVFDCRLHGCSQDTAFPAEKQSPWNSMEDDGIPCGINCYKLVSKLDATTTIDPHMTIDTEPTRLSDNTRKQLTSNKKKQGSSGRNAESQQTENSSTKWVASESNYSEVHPTSNKASQQISPTGRIKKRTKTGGCSWPRNMKLRSRTLNGHKDSVASSQQNDPSTRSSQKKDAPQLEKTTALAEDRNESTEGRDNEHSATYGHDSSWKEESVDGNICRQEDNGRSWKAIEQGLLVKGLEIFGRNSCLIARNLLGGMKTCSDVFQHLKYTENSNAFGVLSGVDSLANGDMEGHDLRVRSRYFRRRGKARRLKHTSKSAGHHFIRKRIAQKNCLLYQQYNPCGCQSVCDSQCPCLKNETCCEKYCGCPKMCKNRFRGCHCAKSQCRSRQCPCFAADRECDPDVCRNCWVACGDGSCGFPKNKGDNYECRNMKVLLKEQQRILLGRSDVSGWGAFLKNTVGKDEYLGEYTGELISHPEAGMRGTIYDLENSNFLFNLNNEFVLDAYRMGNKLKFANHSHAPNCYAKVMLVAGDHRVGIFAKERIDAGEEIFYDYNFAADETPAWAVKPDDPGAKDPGQPSCGRTKKPDAPGAKDPGQPSCARAKKPAH